jgi:ABC-type phosphate transport system substrate-binding protein
MKAKFNISITLFALLLLIATTAFAPFQAPGGVIIVHPATPSETITPAQAKLLYLRKVKRLWPNNKPIKPVAFKGTAGPQRAFFTKVLQMTPEDVAQYFKQRQFANSEAPPNEVASEAEMIDYVSNNEGAIGYVNTAVAEAAGDKVKIITKF